MDNKNQNASSSITKISISNEVMITAIKQFQFETISLLTRRPKNSWKPVNPIYNEATTTLKAITILTQLQSNTVC